MLYGKKHAKADTSALFRAGHVQRNCMHCCSDSPSAANVDEGEGLAPTVLSQFVTPCPVTPCPVTPQGHERSDLSEEWSGKVTEVESDSVFTPSCHSFHSLSLCFLSSHKAIRKILHE